MSFDEINPSCRLPERSVKPKSTWALLKPHFETLVSSYVYPQLSFTSAKQEQWDSDPIEFVRTTVGMCI